MAIVTLKKKKSKVFWSYNHKCYVLPQLIFEDWVKSEKDRKFKIRRKAEVVYIQGDTERHSCFRKKKSDGIIWNGSDFSETTPLEHKRW